MKRPKDISAKLKVCEPELNLYICELEKINLRLHMKIAKLQAQNMDYQNEIKTLKKLNPQADININFFPSHNKKPAE